MYYMNIFPLNEVRNKDFNITQLISFDFQALCANASEGGALISIQSKTDGLSDEDLSLRKSDYLKLVAICMKFSEKKKKDQILETLQNKRLIQMTVKLGQSIRSHVGVDAIRSIEGTRCHLSSRIQCIQLPATLSITEMDSTN